MKKLDLAVIALVAALSLLPLAFLARGATQTVVVMQHGEILYEAPLEQDASIAADGCVVTIEHGRAFVSQADCPDGLCRKSGAATAARPVICLPNELVITIADRGEEAFDGLAY